MAQPTLDAFGIVSKDLQRSIDFYTLVGVPEPAEKEGPHWECVLSNGIRIMFDHIDLIREIMPDYVEPVGNRMGLAFNCENAAQVDATFKAVVDAGFSAKLEPIDAFWGQRYATLIDPDGNLVDLFANL